MSAPAIISPSPKWFTRDGRRASDIITAVAEHFGYAEVLILGRRRPRSLTRARQVAMYLVREHTELSYCEIAHLFGRDHSTIIHAWNTIQHLMTQSKPLARSVEMIAAQIEVTA